jgi:hypothetical protein
MNLFTLYPIKRGIIHVGTHTYGEIPAYITDAQKFVSVLWIAKDSGMVLPQYTDDYASSEALLNLGENILKQNEDIPLSPIHKKRKLDISSGVFPMRIIPWLKTEPLEQLLLKNHIQFDAHDVLSIYINDKDSTVIQCALTLSVYVNVVCIKLDDDKNKLLPEIDSFLINKGFIKAEKMSNENHGEVVYVRNTRATHRNLGKLGRMGNQLFQIASVIGAVNGQWERVILPPWKYSHAFTGTHQMNDSFNLTDNDIIFHTEFEGRVLNAIKFIPINTTPPLSRTGDIINVDGYRQNILYFKEITDMIRDTFQPRDFIAARLVECFPIVNEPHSVGIHVRRTDYLTIPSFNYCTESYFRAGIELICERLRNHGIDSVVFIFFSDDIQWCKNTFGDVFIDAHNFRHSLYYSPFTDEVDDLFALSMCHHKIIANSSFSWWATFIGNNHRHTIASCIVAPWPWITLENLEFYSIYQPGWTIMDVNTCVPILETGKNDDYMDILSIRYNTEYKTSPGINPQTWVLFP